MWMTGCWDDSSVCNLLLQMIKPAFIFRINIRIKNEEKKLRIEKNWLMSQYPWKERCNDFKNRKYKYKKVDKYILSLKHRGWKKVWTRCRKQEGVKMSHIFLAAATK